MMTMTATRGGNSTTSWRERGATREALPLQDRGVRRDDRGVHSSTSQHKRGTAGATREKQ